MSEYKDKPYSTARYKIIYGSCQNRYRFFCASSGAAVYTSKPIRAETIEEELKQVWEKEARPYFNQCKTCGQWVCDVMYNPDMLECVDCAPWQNPPHFCSNCGAPVSLTDNFCGSCGMSLKNGGDRDKQREQLDPT